MVSLAYVVVEVRLLLVVFFRQKCHKECVLRIYHRTYGFSNPRCWSNFLFILRNMTCNMMVFIISVVA